MQPLFWNGVCPKLQPQMRTSWLIEEVAALIFGFYVFSLVIDLLPSVRTRRRVPQGEKYPFPGLEAGQAARVKI